MCVCGSEGKAESGGEGDLWIGNDQLDHGDTSPETQSTAIIIRLNKNMWLLVGTATTILLANHWPLPTQSGRQCRSALGQSVGLLFDF